VAGKSPERIAVAFLLFDAFGKLLKATAVIEGTAKLGFPETAIVPIGCAGSWAWSST
jgi:hypothetical protein